MDFFTVSSRPRESTGNITGKEGGSTRNADCKILHGHHLLIELSWQEVDISLEGHVFVPITVSTFTPTNSSEIRVDLVSSTFMPTKTSEPAKLISCRRLSCRPSPMSQTN